MLSQRKAGLFSVAGLVVFLLVVSLPISSIAADKPETLDFGVVSWSESLAIGDLIEYIFEEEIGYPVEVDNPDIGVALTALKNKELDLFIEMWLPVTHESYWPKVAHQLMDFGPIYEGAKLGWAVPKYMENVNSVADLGKPEIKEALNGKVYGGDPSSGLWQHSEEMINTYPELEGYEITESSEFAMLAVVKRKLMKEEPVLFYEWKPHFTWATFSEEQGGPGLKWIEEPRNILGGEERVHMVGREDFIEVFPDKVSRFLSRFYLPIDKVNELTFLYDQDKITASEKFVDKYPSLVHYWVTGKIKEVG